MLPKKVVIVSVKGHLNEVIYSKKCIFKWKQMTNNQTKELGKAFIQIERLSPSRKNLLSFANLN